MISTINFQEHPTNRNMKVFYFSKEEHAAYFERLLIENGVDFEKQVDTEGDQRIYYGIHIKHFEVAKKLNYLTIGAFRSKFIPDVYFRYFLIAVSIAILGLAIVGALVSE